ncbi:ATP-grasp domain-containing protein [Actinoplanes sp. NPDC051346]|uniref:ATP-grasp domain-containing protein n=1 Tax=Actinoplanes sp. NPDC051346 TaxID=3155048 RepID=UPI003447701B
MLVFIEAGIAGTGLSALAWAVDNGLDVGLVSTAPEQYADVPAGDLLPGLSERGRVFRSADTDTQALDAGLVDWVRASGTPHGVVCIGDRHLPYAAALAEELGVPFHPAHAIAVLRDKRVAREHYEALDIRSPRWSPADDVNDALALLDAVDGPIVLKNVKGSGSLDVLLCRTPAEVREHHATLADRQRYLGGDLMAEQFVTGPLYSIETVVDHGRAVTLGITDRQLGPRPHFCEVSYTFPAAVPGADADEMVGAVEACAKHFGLTHGFLHSEFVLTAEGPVLVEVNARLGGGLLALMMNDCLTVSCWELLCRGALGERLPDVAHNGLYASTVTVYPAESGVVATLPDRDAAGRSPFVTDVVWNAGPGDEVYPPRDHRGAVCQIRARAGSASLAYNAALAAARDVRVTLTSRLVTTAGTGGAPIAMGE